MRRVVITGMGIVSCLGNSIDEVVSSLRAGASGIHFDPKRKELGFRSGLTGMIKNYTMPEVPKRTLRQMGEGSCLALGAVDEAIRDAELSPEEVGHERTGVVVGNLGNMKDTYVQCDALVRKTRKLGGNAMQRVMTSSVSANLAVFLGIQGYAMTVGTACASGATAVIQGSQLIRAGVQDRMLCGGVQEGTWQSTGHFDALRAFSLREDAPTQASRPFDKDRDGLVPSCGAGFVVLEEFNAAVSRGATAIHAELLGHAMNCDGYDMTAPSGVGGRRCIELALEDAGIDASKVDYVNAHATGTQLGDVSESRILASLFGERPYVSSTKSMTGHELGTAGSSELIYTLLALQHGFVPPNVNLDEVDPECQGIRLVANQALEVPLDAAISNSFGFGGINTCLVVRRHSHNV